MRRSRATNTPRCANFVARCGSVRRDTASNINEARERARQVTTQQEKWASAARPEVVQPFRSGTRCHFTHKDAVQLLEFRQADDARHLGRTVAGRLGNLFVRLQGDLQNGHQDRIVLASVTRIVCTSLSDLSAVRVSTVGCHSIFHCSPASM